MGNLTYSKHLRLVSINLFCSHEDHLFLPKCNKVGVKATITDNFQTPLYLPLFWVYSRSQNTGLNVTKSQLGVQKHSQGLILRRPIFLWEDNFDKYNIDRRNRPRVFSEFFLPHKIRQNNDYGVRNIKFKFWLCYT